MSGFPPQIKLMVLIVQQNRTPDDLFIRSAGVSAASGAGHADGGLHARGDFQDLSARWVDVVAGLRMAVFRDW